MQTKKINDDVLAILLLLIRHLRCTTNSMENTTEYFTVFFTNLCGYERRLASDSQQKTINNMSKAEFH